MGDVGHESAEVAASVSVCRRTDRKRLAEFPGDGCLIRVAFFDGVGPLNVPAGSAAAVPAV
jgi:hypothetical protein